MSEARVAPNGGLYIHIPFCVHKCAYCDFYSVSDLNLKPAFLKALSAEIAAAEAGPPLFDTIYFGGGTPSILDPAEVERIIDQLKSKFRLAGALEVTLEANPGTVDADNLKGFRSAGVNRLNLGIQSFREENLRRLGRIHSAGQAHDAVAAAHRAGFANVGLDLIYGLPGQTVSAWTMDIESALAYDPEHLACYMLSVEPGTPLAEEQRLGRFRPAPDEDTAGLFMATSELLTGCGYHHYEISNFARGAASGGDSRASRHNSKYWAYAPYLGFGPAAHSFQPPRRFWNHRDVRGYIAEIAAGRRPPGGTETLTVDQHMLEVVMLGLRTSAGIDRADFKVRFGRDFRDLYGAVADELAARGLLTLDNGRCAPTRQGMLFLNTVVAALTGN
ncbi:MAG: radical SAM family heme chaperone HemW [Desulfobacterales bacterium]|jgi:oxygen-independent coproporphyrinogen-3 oxidase|nr:radical SAM family heme chaperone HemW [Desulfobacterales bacterium]